MTEEAQERGALPLFEAPRLGSDTAMGSAISAGDSSTVEA
jgi:hypothetical protein